MADLLTLLRQTKDKLGSGIGAAVAPSAAPGSNLVQAQGLGAAMRNVAPSTGPGTGPKVSNVQETVGNIGAAEQLRDVATEAAQTKREVAVASDSIARSAETAKREESLAELEMSERAAAHERTLLERARQAKAAGDLAAYEASLDQAQFVRRLSNEKYIQGLQQAGALSRLGDEAGFKEALINDVFGEELVTLQRFLGWKEIMAADDREFQERLGQIDLQAAIDLAETKAGAANTAAIASGASGVVSGGIQAYDASEKADEKQKKGVAEKQAKIDAYKKEQGIK